MKFYKFDGAGNDFILVDTREQRRVLSQDQVAWLCHRRFGIGADGLMTLNTHSGYDFEMRYYNSDGKLGSMCGNGGRCITAFAYLLGIRERCCRNSIISSATTARTTAVCYSGTRRRGAAPCG